MTATRVFAKNATYQYFEVLKTNRNKRHRHGAFLVEGVRNINAAIRYEWRIRSFLFSREKPLSRWAASLLEEVPTEENFELAPTLMREISGKADTSELLAIVAMRKDALEVASLSELPLLALFDRPSNRGNLGTILRSCDALGVEGLLMTGHAVDLYDPEVIVSSMGSFFRVPVARVPDIASVQAFVEAARARFPSFAVVGTSAHAQTPLYAADLTVPSLILIGNETDGLSHALAGLCDTLVTIPMDADADASSLNVGCAATVLFYEARRQRA